MPSILAALATSALVVSVVSAQSTGSATRSSRTTSRATTSTRRATTTSSAAASTSTTPLAAKSFTYPNLPYKVDTDDGERGVQFGYNVCNSTTEGQESLCQTSFINSIDDFCLWAPPEPDSVVGDVEGSMVAWCTKPGRGTRLIPEGALQGVQFLKAPSYVEVVGIIDQTKINIQAEDYGGEMDPHGADQRGNPLGGLLFTQAFGSSNSSSWTQVVQWHNFMGGNVFCLKACDPADDNDWHYCEHIFDRIGCKYNAPAAYQNGTFESCDSENQQFPGVYIDANGTTQTYTQPAESLGVITTIPYEPVLPSTSNCTPYESASLYTALASVHAPTTTTAEETTAATETATNTDTDATSAAEETTSAATSVTRGQGAAGNTNTAPTSSTASGAGQLNRAVSGAVAGLALVAGLAALA